MVKSSNYCYKRRRSSSPRSKNEPNFDAGPADRFLNWLGSITCIIHCQWFYRKMPLTKTPQVSSVFVGTFYLEIPLLKFQYRAFEGSFSVTSLMLVCVCVLKSGQKYHNECFDAIVLQKILKNKPLFCKMLVVSKCKSQPSPIFSAGPVTLRSIK